MNQFGPVAEPLGLSVSSLAPLDTAWVGLLNKFEVFGNKKNLNI